MALFRGYIRSIKGGWKGKQKLPWALGMKD